MNNTVKITTWDWKTLSDSQRQQILQRPVLEQDQSLQETAAEIIQGVRRHGDQSLFSLTEKLDGVKLESLEISRALWKQAEQQLPVKLISAMQHAAKRIRGFHAFAMPHPFSMQTAPGVCCETQYRPIQRVGLYVPAGSAPLPSTMLMLGIPAQLVGCQELIVCSPPNQHGQVDSAVLAAARLCDATRVFAVGGAQAIAAMAYGTESIPKCDKLFGPGNQWVMQAKQQVSIDPQGAAIDMPAGPSEVLVITDGNARPEWIAADLLSQAEHGPDSQVLLISTDQQQLPAIEQAINQQLSKLPRAAIACMALENSMAIVVENLAQALQVSNQYAPEHLILALENARELVPDVLAAGSVFVGQYTPESLGDYCSGTNHVLPTAGWARSFGSLSTSDFMTRMTVQEASPEGILEIGPDAISMATHEQLQAHAMAVQLRLDELRNIS